MAAKKQSPKNTVISNCSVQVGPSSTTPPATEAVVAIARAAERVAEALNTLARRVSGPEIDASECVGIQIHGSDPRPAREGL